MMPTQRVSTPESSSESAVQIKRSKNSARILLAKMCSNSEGPGVWYARDARPSMLGLGGGPGVCNASDARPESRM